MKWIGISIITIFCMNVFAQPKYFELKQGELVAMIEEAHLVAAGRISKIEGSQCTMRPTEIFKGPQRLSSIVIDTPDPKGIGLETEVLSLFFLKRIPEGRYAFCSGQSLLKHDLFLGSRVRTEVMRWKIDTSDQVAVARIKAIEEVPVGDNSSLAVVAQCEKIYDFKGTPPPAFFVKYQRLPNALPPTLFLFKDFNYIFFLKHVQGTEYKIDPYEGAYRESFELLKEIKLITRVENRFDAMAGQVVDGIRLLARIDEEILKKDKGTIDMILQNASNQEIEIYYNQVPYFILFHILDESGKSVGMKYPRKNSVPSIDKTHFVKLEIGGYCTTPSFFLKDYCQLQPGKYSLYVEFHLPPEYAGKSVGKTGWSGKIVSNKIEITVTE